MAETVVERGQMFGTHCAACGSEFTEDDRPTYTGPFARIAATGLSMTCRLCREHAEVKRLNDDRAELRRTASVLKWETLSALRIPNLVRWLDRRLAR